MSVWDDVATRLHEVARDQATRASPPVRRYKVLRGNPLLITDLHGDLILEEGDDDFEVAKALQDTPPAKGDVVVVHEDEKGYRIAHDRITRDRS